MSMIASFFSTIWIVICFLAAIGVFMLQIVFVPLLLWYLASATYYALRSVWELITRRPKHASFSFETAGEALKLTAFMIAINLVLAMAAYGLAQTEGGQEAHRPMDPNEYSPFE